MASKGRPGNNFFEIIWALRKQEEEVQVISKNVTRMASKGRPGNKFFEIIWASRKQREK